MAPLQPGHHSSRPAAPSMFDLSMSPLFTSQSVNSADLDLDLDLDLDHRDSRALYAHSFDRPESARSLPTGRFRKNMKEMTGFRTTEEEFDSLPIAVRRKFFSTRERLHIAQNSRSNALHELNELPIQSHRKSSLADRRGISVNLIEPRRSASSSRRQRKLARQQSVSSNEASWFLTLPDKIKKKQFTREEQVILAAHLRESVILDAADEAIFKASRRASRNLTPLFGLPLPSSARDSFETDQEANEEDSDLTMTAMYESFRWMDEEKDLDLKLVLDDYHANLDGVVIPTPESIRRPSFRRQMSISKMPFGRSSLSSLRPRSPKFESLPSPHQRQKSRTLSLITPKHMPKDSISSIDPNAAHYQDPEARLKLRVYLASPQKFDEAIEFGFPSLDAVADGTDKENKLLKRISKDATRRKASFSATDRGHSFLNDDTASLFEDDVSMADPESPVTPLGIDSGFRQNRLLGPSIARGSKSSSDFLSNSSNRPTLVKQPETYSHAMAGSREMTLRMTLTRPDLRADENTIYGWQTSKSSLREEQLPMAEEKDEMKGPFGGTDGWGPLEKENGVVKRLWHRVSRSQKKFY